MYVKRWKKVLAGAGMAMVLAVSMLQGCGGSPKPVSQDDTKKEADSGKDAKEEKAKAEEAKAGPDYAKLLEDMKEFTTKDGSVSIKLNKDWGEEDLGLDFWLGVQNAKGHEAVLVMQFPKAGTMQLADSMDSVKAMVNETCKVTDETAAEAPGIPGMTGVTASTCKANTDGVTVDGYLVYGETDYAYYALIYVAEKMGDEQIDAMKASCTSFVETPIEEEDHTTVEISDTVRWFNASYAILTEINGGDYNRFAGFAANDSMATVQQQSLSEWWDVTDRASADETLDWILTEGHRTGFAEDMKYLKEQGMGDVAAEERKDFLLGLLDVTDEEAENYANSYALYEEFGENAIDGWDYCRAMNLLSFYYLAGYYTEAEALDKSLEIAGTMQPLFTSWDDLIASYLRGYEYWAEESSEERQAVYDDLKTRDDNPYAVDYNMTLEKTW